MSISIRYNYLGLLYYIVSNLFKEVLKSKVSRVRFSLFSLVSFFIIKPLPFFFKEAFLEYCISNKSMPPPQILKQLSFNVPNRSGENSVKDFLRRNRLVSKKTKSFKNKFFITCGSDTEL